ncbi:MAG TPA: hypothetical protein ENH35_03610, partial [Candidatus Moranbacteria bacterium]|nr:hypothetical protein [Candidatus Moranbacteria bacterium]
MIKKLLTRIYDNFAKSVWYTSTFVLMLIVYLLASVIRFLGKFTPQIMRDKLKGPLNNLHVHILKFSRHSKNTINRVNLIELAIKSMNFKRSRSIITIGGMAVGIGAIVFLVSLGYGLQKLVISRVAKLNEMRQVNIVSQTGSQIKINDKSLAKFRGISDVEAVLPVIAVVGKVDFQGSVSDMAVYGVTSDYLRQSAIQPVRGDIFESNDIVAEVFGQVSELEEVARGDEKKVGEKAREEIN